jgi:hypothetical protein
MQYGASSKKVINKVAHIELYPARSSNKTILLGCLLPVERWYVYSCLCVRLECRNSRSVLNCRVLCFVLAFHCGERADCSFIACDTV